MVSALLNARLQNLTILVSLSSNCDLCRPVKKYGSTSTKFKLTSCSVCNPCGNAVPMHDSLLWNVWLQNWHICNGWLNVLYLPWSTWILLQCALCYIVYTNFSSRGAGVAYLLWDIIAILGPLVWGVWIVVAVAAAVPAAVTAKYICCSDDDNHGHWWVTCRG